MVANAPEDLDTLKEISDWISTHESSAAAMNSAIQSKVDKVDGKGLSTNDFTNDYKDKLDGIVEGANDNVQADWSVTDVSSNAYIKNKPTSLPASDVSDWAKAATKPDYTASEVGADPAGSADTALTDAKTYADGVATNASTDAKNYADGVGINTLESAKNYADGVVSNKVDKVTGKGLSTNDLTDELKLTYDTTVSDVNTLKGTGTGSISKTVTDEIAKIVSNAPEDLDTLKEISDWISTHESSAAAMNSAISDNSVAITSLQDNKADKSEIPTTLPANGGNADTVNGHTVKSDVPENAVFTDTIYDDTEVKGSITDINSNLETIKYNLVQDGISLLPYTLWGNNVYRKHLSIGSLPKSSTVSINTGLPDTARAVVGIYGWIYHTNGTRAPLPYVSPVPEQCIALSTLNSGKTLVVTTGMDRSDFSADIFIDYV